MKTNRRNVVKILERLTEYVRDDCPESKTVFAEQFDVFLDDLCSDGYFGTEAQLDPRGDHRR
jgi:hypothetical protein